MDTVYNQQEGPYIQTFIFQNTGLMIGFLHTEKTSESMASTLDNLQVTTIRGNEVRGHNDRKLGIGTQGMCCKKVAQINKDGEIVHIFNSSNEAARVLNLCRQNINKVCNGERHSTGGFKFQYLNS